MSYYRNISADELQRILANHSLWRRTYGEQGERANLTRANLTQANLTRANLTRANLTDADLTDANLTDADLTRANLTRANLTRAYLTRADLTRANLTDANLTPIKQAVFSVLSIYPHEVKGLLEYLQVGKIDGSMYTGECACLRGTIAKLRHCDYKDLSPNVSSLEERWFMGIQRGDTPDNAAVARITANWIQEWLSVNEVTGANQ